MSLTDQELNDAVRKLVDDGHQVVLSPDAAKRLDPTIFKVPDPPPGPPRQRFKHLVCHTQNGNLECEWKDEFQIRGVPTKPPTL